MNGNQQDVIVVLGDSLTQGASAPGGFANLLSYVYNRKFDVLNRGFSGYNSTWTLAAFKQCLVKRDEATPHNPKIRLLTIWLGANDSVLPTKKQYVSLVDFSNNLTKIIHLVASPSSEYYSPDTKVILLTPPPVNTYQRGADLASRDPSQECDRTFINTSRYAEAVREVAARESVPVVDVYTRLWEGCGKEEKRLDMYLRDGLHVNEKAYELIYQDIMRTIKTHFPEIHYENLKPVFPLWDQIDPNNPDVEKRVII